MAAAVTPKGLGARWRAMFFRAVRRASATDDARDLVSEHLRGLQVACPVPESLRGPVPAWPYADVDASQEPPGAGQRADTILITGRFRSGSTLLWNLFRHAGTTAYYEPFNERRWFDHETRGDRIDPTHRGVANYWEEYEGLQDLARYYDDSWYSRRLYMPREAHDPAMKRYLEMLIERAPRRPVLQFNRLDFRLPWCRGQFPHATLLHIYRHPRDQWCSTLAGTAFGPDRCLADFHTADHYYLRLWAQDLKHYFPFLTLGPDSHPYELFFEIWRLSYWFGRAHADLSISFESLLDDPAGVITRLFDACRLPVADLGRLTALVQPVATGGWRRYADAEWFAAIERRVNRRFEDYLSVVAEGPVGISAARPARGVVPRSVQDSARSPVPAVVQRQRPRSDEPA